MSHLVIIETASGSLAAYAYPLCQHSAFFRRALSESWQAAASFSGITIKSLDLRTESKTVMRAFILFATKHLPQMKETFPSSGYDTLEQGMNLQLQLLQAYVFANKYDAPKFANRIRKIVLMRMEDLGLWVFSVADYELIHASLPETDRLRLLLDKWWVQNKKSAWITDDFMNSAVAKALVMCAINAA